MHQFSDVLSQFTATEPNKSKLTIKPGERLNIIAYRMQVKTEAIMNYYEERIQRRT